MTTDECHGIESDPFERLLALPPGGERNQLLADLSPQARVEARRVVEAADLVWADAHGAPPLEHDPVAAMLGLVPDPDYQLNARALKNFRSRANIKSTALAAALSRRGWPISAGDVFTWEHGGAASVSPALLRAVAEELHIDPDLLITTTTGRNQSMYEQSHMRVASDVTKSPKFRALVQRFGRTQEMSIGMAGSTLHSRMLATVHRGQQPSPEQMLAALEAFIEALESDR